MRPSKLAGVGCLLLTSAWLTQAGAQGPVVASRVTLYEGARLIVGDGNAPIEDAAFLVENARFTRVGRRGDVPAPSGAARVDLTGKTVIPALVDGHSHIGYMKHLTSGAANYTRENILEQDELGMVAAGKSADFVVLDANPLDDITNTRKISSVYLRGTRVDREKLRAGFGTRQQ
jgi:imidazolonepropionase-like amidohydrolase